MGPIITELIEFRTTRGGESKAYIAGTRISVENIYVCHELQRMTPDEIVAAYPHISLAQVHGALAYYFEHSSEIREQMKRSKAFAVRMEAEQGHTVFSQLRDQSPSFTDGHDDPVSS